MGSGVIGFYVGVRFFQIFCTSGENFASDSKTFQRCKNIHGSPLSPFRVQNPWDLAPPGWGKKKFDVCGFVFCQLGLLCANDFTFASNAFKLLIDFDIVGQGKVCIIMHRHTTLSLHAKWRHRKMPEQKYDIIWFFATSGDRTNRLRLNLACKLKEDHEPTVATRLPYLALIG